MGAPTQSGLILYCPENGEITNAKETDTDIIKYKQYRHDIRLYGKFLLTVSCESKS